MGFQKKVKIGDWVQGIHSEQFYKIRIPSTVEYINKYPDTENYKCVSPLINEILNLCMKNLK